MFESSVSKDMKKIKIKNNDKRRKISQHEGEMLALKLQVH